MRELQFQVEINATKGRVWATLWEDHTFREWANIIDEGTYMKGVMREGDEIQFISSVNGYGVTSMIEKLVPDAFVSIRHSLDTKESGQQIREKEWNGGMESYSLIEKNNVTMLIVKMEVPENQEETFKDRFPKALECVKSLAEKVQYARLNVDNEVEAYNLLQSSTDQEICKVLITEISKNLPDSKSKIWHGSPVWFMDGNPIVGYCKLKNCIQLLFWSGQTFDETGLKPVGKYKAAEARFIEPDQINRDDLTRWLIKSIQIQWDYKNIAKSKGELHRLK